MFSLSLDYQGFDALDHAIESLMRARDLLPLAQDMRAIMIADNAQRTTSGVDLNGVTLEPITEFTRQHRDGNGPPLAPQGAGAMLISDYTVDINAPTPQDVVVVGYWPNTPWVRFHVDGFVNARTGRFVPARNPVGITPDGQQRVAEAFERFVADTAQAFGATG
jgi:hypothetical protein